MSLLNSVNGHAVGTACNEVGGNQKYKFLSVQFSVYIWMWCKKKIKALRDNSG